MNKQVFRNIAVVLGAAALFSFHAQAADAASQADPWPAEAPATIYFGDTDDYGTGPRRPDVPATVGFGNTAGPAEQRKQAATALAHKDSAGGTAPRMY
jgi:hypothetical protein